MSYPANAREIVEAFHFQVPLDILEKRMEKYPFFGQDQTWPYECYVCGEQSGCTYGDGNIMGALSSAQ